MGREQPRIKGRDSALAVLRSALRSGAQHGRLVVVRGSAGVGRTRLLAEMSRRWRTHGVRVAEIRAGGRDRHGVDVVVEALRNDFDRLGDPGLVDGISALVRLCGSGAGFPAVVAELGRVFGRIGGLGPTAVLVDDVLEIADPAALLLAARRPGCLLVASVRADGEPTKVAELLDMADEVLDLEPLADGDMAAVAELDEAAHRALRTALGELYGNPGTVLATLDLLREQGRLVASGDGLNTLTDPDSPIALPGDHDLLRRARRLGELAAQLLAVAGGALDLDDLPSVAAALGSDVAECGRMVDRLVGNGLLVVAPWGRLHCACPALAAAVAPLRRLPVERNAARTPSEVDSPVVPLTRPAPAREHRPGSPLAWSPTEERIVELIGTGRTNRQIGTVLGLSEKTVESHVTRLLAKSGCRSRVGLVVTANRRHSAVLGRPAA
ncbi:regulatory protein, luxR family [Saccharopolyspora antimicrobica]|uniref:Regulatory LuxR family protein n=1 Tax=Saccharopolyspora antimicrobica TaxID=455193 RepID=A0A1I5B645_9PSEU|nr:LuxR C-terminal-related transcriptional regulator [Saccharopolyspora antimicrobica]RKT86476.1 regulatory LuxR family protein [Saccharopolyspora antimicrobica]SFN70080.1 regulatory protein, luxR family [Saccharopolyspora antimicrobica]